MIRKTTDNREAWHAERRTAIGASETPTFYGKGFVNPYRLWAIKSGLVERDESDEDNEGLEWGTLLQPSIVEGLRRRLDMEIIEAPQDVFLRHPRLSFLGCTPDAYADDPVRGRGVWEIKNVGAYLANDWSDDVPLRVQVQVQTQLAVTGLAWGGAAGLVGGNRLKWYIIDRHEKFIADLEERAAEFWDRVLTGNPPQVDGSEDSTRTLKQLHPADNGAATALAIEYMAIAEEIESLAKDATAKKKRLDFLKNQVREAIGSHTFAALPDGRWASYKTQHNPGHTVEPYDYRVLRFHDTKPKEVADVPFSAPIAAATDLPAGVELHGDMPDATPRLRHGSYEVARKYLMSVHPHCRWCEAKLTSSKSKLDFLVPPELGGENEDSNYVLACPKCVSAGATAIYPSGTVTK